LLFNQYDRKENWGYWLRFPMSNNSEFVYIFLSMNLVNEHRIGSGVINWFSSSNRYHFFSLWNIFLNSTQFNWNTILQLWLNLNLNKLLSNVR
jgi:hypothetical protein